MGGWRPRLVVLAACLGLGGCDDLGRFLLLPQTVTISTDVHRVCRGEIRTEIAFNAMGGGEQTVIVPIAIRFAATRIGDSYQFVETTTVPQGESSLQALVSLEAAVSIASYTPAMLAGVDLSGMALEAARNLPERTVMGRTFVLGTEYFSPEAQGDFMRQYARSTGLPLSVSGDLHLPFMGSERTPSGEVSLVWEGDGQFSGSGEVSGSAFVYSARLSMRRAHDADTGLLREMSGGPIEVRLNGERFLEMNQTVSITCDILPN